MISQETLEQETLDAAQLETLDDVVAVFSDELTTRELLQKILEELKVLRSELYNLRYPQRWTTSTSTTTTTSTPAIPYVFTGP